MDFGGGPDDQHLKLRVVEDDARTASYVPEVGADRPLDELDELLGVLLSLSRAAAAKVAARAAGGEVSQRHRTRQVATGILRRFRGRVIELRLTVLGELPLEIGLD